MAEVIPTVSVQKQRAFPPSFLKKQKCELAIIYDGPPIVSLGILSLLQ